MIDGLLPPSSRHTRFTRAAADAWIARPVATEPVNEITSTCGCATTAAPTVSPTPWTTLNTPGGIPASSASSATTHGGHRRLLGGLQHDAVAGAERKGPNAAAAVGPFQGTTDPTTPTGSRT